MYLFPDKQAILKNKVLEEYNKRIAEDSDGVLDEEELEDISDALTSGIEKEIKKKKKFDHQRYLLHPPLDIPALGKGRTEKGARKILQPDRIYSVTGASNNTIGQLRNRSEGYKILSLPTDKLSLLVPKMRFYKVEYTHGIPEETEICFPTTSLILADTTKIFLGANPNDHTFFKNRDGYGIKSFDWEYSGQDTFTSKTDIKASLVLYFQDMAQLLATRAAPNNKPFKYLDLLVSPEMSEEEGTFHTIKADVGWFTPMGFDKLEAEIIEANNESLRLNMIDYAFDFDANASGAFYITINYRAAIEGAVKNSSLDILLPDLETCRKIKTANDRIKKATTEKKKNKAKQSAEKEIKKLRVKSMEKSRTLIINKLIESNSIYFLTVPLTDILNFEGFDPRKIKEIITAGQVIEKDLINSIKEEEEYLTPKTEDNSEKIVYTFLGDIIQVCSAIALDEKNLAAIGDKTGQALAKFTKVITSDVILDGKSINIADIPVDLRLFSQFFYDKVVNQDTDRKPLGLFLVEMLKYLIQNRIENIFEESEADEKVYKMTFLDSAANLSGYDTITEAAAKLERGSTYTYLTIYTDSLTGAGAAEDLTIGYSYPKSVEKDAKRGINHFILGSNNSSVKNFSLEKTSLEYERERRLIEGSSPYSILRNVFTADIGLIGNGLFYPGTYVYINPGHAMGDGGRPWVQGTIFNIMGLGGYHVITSVKNSIKENVFETSITAKFEASGNP